MAVSIAQATDFAMHLEDSRMSGNITGTKGDPGGLTRYGLACKWHPELLAQGYFSQGMPNGKALQIAQQVYAEKYAAPLLLDQFASQAIVNRVLAAAVNIGIEPATKLLQQAIDQLTPNAVAVDGQPGPFTVAAANRCMEASLLACFRVQTISYHIGLNEPEFVLGWVRRDLA